MKTRKYILAGYHGFGNRGDDLLTLAVAKSLAESGCRPELAILSGPRPGQEIYAVPGVRIIPRQRMLLTRQLFSELLTADGLIYTGGTLFTGRNTASDLSYALPAMLARILLKKRYFYGQGLGSFTTPLTRWMTRTAMSGSRIIHLRDQNSLETANQLKITAEEILLSVDPVFSLHQPGRFLARGATPGSRKIAINFRPLPHRKERETEEIAIIQELAGREGCTLFLVPMSEEDHKLHQDRLASVEGICRERIRLIRPDLSTDGLLSLLSGMDAAIGMRLHFHIMAMLAGTPSLALAYDPKVDALFMQMQLLEFCLPAAGIDPGQLAVRLRGILERRTELSAYVLRRTAQSGSRARDDLHYLGQLMQGKENPQDA